MKIETLLMTQEKWKQKGEGKHQEKVDDLDRNVPSPEVVATIQGGLYLITVIPRPSPCRFQCFPHCSLVFFSIPSLALSSLGTKGILPNI